MKKLLMGLLIFPAVLMAGDNTPDWNSYYDEVNNELFIYTEVDNMSITLENKNGAFIFRAYDKENKELSGIQVHCNSIKSKRVDNLPQVMVSCMSRTHGSLGVSTPNIKAFFPMGGSSSAIRSLGDNPTQPIDFL